MANCDEVRKYIKDYLEDNGAEASSDKIDELVKVCCDDLGSAECRDALINAVVTGVCTVYTDGACVPCCETLGDIVGPILGKGIGYAIQGIESAWNFVSGLFGGGDDECNKVKQSYKTSGDALVTEYSKASRDIVDALAKSWDAMRMKVLGFDYLDGMYPIVKEDNYGFLYPTSKDDPDRVRWQYVTDPVDGTAPINEYRAWDVVILNNVAHRLVLATDTWGPNGRTWTISGTNDKVISPPLDIDNPPITMEQLYYFYWQSFSCKEPNNWLKFAKDVQKLRFNQFMKEIDVFTERMVIETNEELEAAKSDDNGFDAITINKSQFYVSGSANIISKKDATVQKSHFWSWTLGAAAILAAGGTGYYFWNKKR